MAPACAVVALLLEAHPAGARAAAEHGWLPLHRAVERGAGAAAVAVGQRPIGTAYPSGSKY